MDSSGSRGITLVKQAEEVSKAAEQAFSCSRKEYILVEEFLSGIEIGVDGVVRDGQIVFLAPHDKFVYKSEKITIPAGHSFPYSGGKEAEKEICHQMELAAKSLGLRNCFFNADVFVNAEKVSVIEMGGRTGATCIPELISMYYGFDFYKKILESAMGEKTSFHEKEKKSPCMARLLMSPRDGVITFIDEEKMNFYKKILESAMGEKTSFHEKEKKSPCMARLLMSPRDGVITFIDEEKMKSLREKGALITLDFPVGHTVEKMENGTNRLGHLVSEAENIQEFETVLQEAYSAIFVDGVSLEELWKE